MQRGASEKQFPLAECLLMLPADIDRTPPFINISSLYHNINHKPVSKRTWQWKFSLCFSGEEVNVPAL